MSPDSLVRASQLHAIGHRIEPTLLSDRERHLPERRALSESVEQYLTLVVVAHLYELHRRLAERLPPPAVDPPTRGRLREQAALAAGTMWSATRLAREQLGQSDEEALGRAASATLELLGRPSSGATAIALGGAQAGVQALGAEPGAPALASPALRAIGHAVALYMLAAGSAVLQ